MSKKQKFDNCVARSKAKQDETEDDNVVMEKIPKQKIKPTNSDEVVMSPFKRLKIDETWKCTSPSSLSQYNGLSQSFDFSIDWNDRPTDVDKLSRTQRQNIAKNKNGILIAACNLKIVEELQNIKQRLSFSSSSSIPLCIELLNCPINTVVSSETLSYFHESFKGYIALKNWDMALFVFRNCVTLKFYPSIEMMHEFFDIILNFHENCTKYGQTQKLLLSSCIHTFKYVLGLHPPNTKINRNFYIDILSKPFNSNLDLNKSEKASNRFENMSMSFFQFIINNIERELIPPSNEESIIILERDADLTDNDNREVYTNLDRNTKIHRLFVLMDFIISIFEQDLAIWIVKYGQHSNRHIFGKNKLIIAQLLWGNNVFNIGTINDVCEKLLQIFINLNLLNYPKYNIEIFSRLINIMFHAYQLTDNNTDKIYPFIGKTSYLFENAIFDRIKDENIFSIIKIIVNTNNKVLIYILFKTTLKNTLRSKEENFTTLFVDILKKQIWNQFEIDEKLNDTSLDFTPFENKITESHNIYKIMRIKLKNISFNNVKANDDQAIPKNANKLSNSIKNLSQSEFMLLLSYSLNYYLKTYNSIEIMKKYQELNQQSSKTKDEKIHDCPNNLNDTNILNADNIKIHISGIKFLSQIRSLYNKLKEQNEIPHCYFDSLILQGE